MQTLSNAGSSILMIISSYIPKLTAGLIILVIGLVIASLIKDLVNLIFKYFRIQSWLSKIGLVKVEDVNIWPQLTGEILRWVVIFIFLTSAVEIWGIPKVGEVLNQLLSFLPNVLLTVIIGWAGIIVSRLVFDIVKHGVKGLGKKEPLVLGNIAKYSVLFFTILIILTQLGVAADLVRILFTGIVGMLTLALGLAFGLGGQEEAKKILANLRKKLESK